MQFALRLEQSNPFQQLSDFDSHTELPNPIILKTLLYY